MFGRNDVNLVRQDITGFIGSKVKLESNKGRHKSVVSEGVIENVYPSIFTILLGGGAESRRTVSYSYTDVLTRAVEITLCD